MIESMFQRFLMGIISRSSYVHPFYTELALKRNISFDEVKKQVEDELEDYLRKSYTLRKHYLNKKISYDRFIRDPATAQDAVRYLVKLYGKNGMANSIIKMILET